MSVMPYRWAEVILKIHDNETGSESWLLTSHFPKEKQTGGEGNLS